MKLLFVCLGNICRSPSAEGVMRALIAEAGLAGEIEVESAGTGSWHIGEPADPRSREAAARRGIVLDGTARRFERSDFEGFDRIVAMDRRNLADVLALAPDEAAAEKAVLLREFDPEAAAAGELDVPDPYYGDGDGFEHVLDVVDRACRGLLAQLTAAPAERRLRSPSGRRTDTGKAGTRSSDD